MALGPGAIGNLTQYIPYRAANPGESFLRGVESREREQQNQWYRSQKEKEYDRGIIEEDRNFALKTAEFASAEQRAAEAQRLRKAAAYDELLEAGRGNDPTRLRSAIYAAQAVGIGVDGAEDKLRELESGQSDQQPGPPGQEQPGTKKPMSPEDQAISSELDKVRGDALKGLGDQTPQPGESIGDGWEVVETPPEAKTEAPAPAQWLTNEMEARGEIPVQPGPGMGMGLSPFTGLAPSPGEQALPPQSMPQAGVGGLGGLSPAPAPQKPRGMVAYDMDTGEPLGAIDHERGSARAAEKVGYVFDALGSNARNDKEKRAAAIAKDTAIRMLGQPGVTIEEAIAEGHKRYDHETGNDTAKSVARGGKEEESIPTGTYGGGFSQGTEIGQRELQLHDRAERMGKDMSGLHSVKNVNTAAAIGSQLLSQLKSGNSVSQNEVITHLIKMTQGAKSTDADRQFFLSSSGKLDQYELMFRRWAASGSLPPDFRKNIEAYVGLLQAHNLELKAAVYEKAYNRAMETVIFSGLPPELQEQFARQVANAAVGEGGGGRLRGEKTRESIKSREEGEKSKKSGRAEKLAAEADKIAEELDAP